MTTKEFEQFVERNATKPHMESPYTVGLALAGEVGELLGELKKSIDGPGDAQALYHEMGDVLHYLTRLAAMYGCSLQDLMAGNMAKLRNRGLR